jgi:hypothetical protein
VLVQQAQLRKDSPVAGLKIGAEGCVRGMDVGDLPTAFAR